jgi:murein DD-endopeptidase MepM/ murein hydrolase activator NlpD
MTVAKIKHKKGVSQFVLPTVFAILLLTTLFTNSVLAYTRSAMGPQNKAYPNSLQSNPTQTHPTRDPQSVQSNTQAKSDQNLQTQPSNANSSQPQIEVIAKDGVRLYQNPSGNKTHKNLFGIPNTLKIKGWTIYQTDDVSGERMPINACRPNGDCFEGWINSKWTQPVPSHEYKQPTQPDNQTNKTQQNPISSFDLSQLKSFKIVDHITLSNASNLSPQQLKFFREPFKLAMDSDFSGSSIETDFSPIPCADCKTKEKFAGPKDSQVNIPSGEQNEHAGESNFSTGSSVDDPTNPSNPSADHSTDDNLQNRSPLDSPLDTLESFNDLSDHSMGWPISTDGFSFPLDPSKSYISSEVGFRKMRGKLDYHEGVDFGTFGRPLPFYAMRGGLVYKVKMNCKNKSVDRCNGGYGNQIQVMHNDGTIMFYSHLNQKCEHKINEGQLISVGTPLGCVGATGKGPMHLDVRLLKKGGDPFEVHYEKQDKRKIKILSAFEPITEKLGEAYSFLVNRKEFKSSTKFMDALKQRVFKEDNPHIPR